MTDRFPALVIRDVDGKPRAQLDTLTLSDLPAHDVLVEVAYSSLNYKDALALTGKSRIARRLPMVAGIDLAGKVVESADPRWRPGDAVVVNGWGLSETEWGGYSRFQRLKGDWLTRLPEAFSPEEAMAIGTAGYTAALCVDALMDWGAIQRMPEREVLVTGASGGVGSVATVLLAAAGFKVCAATGSAHHRDYLAQLGAASFVDRSELATFSVPLQKERWAGGIDVAGGAVLANTLAQTAYGGAVAACGLAGGTDLPGTVFPHILRSVTLIGVDSVMAPAEKRERAWARLARDLSRARLRELSQVVDLSELASVAAQLLSTGVRGRVIVDVAR